jgi:DNA-directed RNA polymerase specialized sigma24 family protein
VRLTHESEVERGDALWHMSATVDDNLLNLEATVAEAASGEVLFQAKLHGATASAVEFLHSLEDVLRPVISTPRAKSWAVEEKRRQHSNAYKQWSPEDNEQLLQAHNTGVTVRELAQRFGRGESAITSRLAKLGALAPRKDAESETGSTPS